MNFLNFYYLNSFANKYKALDVLAIFFARWLPYILFSFLIIFSFYYNVMNIFWGALISGILGRGLNEIVHIFYKRKRPAYLETAKVLIPFEKNFSFPSGHASFFFGISFYLFFYNIYLAIIFLLLSLLIGLARVFCGVHWFRDIVGGFFVGLLSACVVYCLTLFYIYDIF